MTDPSPGGTWRLTLLFAAFTLAFGLVVGSAAIVALHGSIHRRDRVALTELLLSQAHLVEAVARFDARFESADVEGGPLAATLEQVAEAQGSFEGFGATGVFVLGERVGDSVAFHVVSRRQRDAAPASLPMDADEALPMRRALAGEEGVTQGPDFRGVPVLAAFRPVDLAGRQFGLVAKKDMAEVHRPVRRTAVAVAFGIAALTLLFSGVFHLRGQPYLRRLERVETALEATESELEALEEELGEKETQIEEREEALDELELRFQATFDQAAVGVAHVSPEGRFIRVNRRFADIIGYEPEEARELTFQEITHPDDLEADLEHFRAVLSGEIDTYSIEKRYLRKDGPVVWIDLTVSLVHEDDGSPAYFIAVILDISKRKALQQQLQRTADELARSNHDLQQFAYVASHDLQEPLRMVASFTQLLADRYGGQLSDEADEYIAFAVDGANRMRALIQGLLRYSRVNTLGEEFTPVNTSLILQDTLDDLQLAIEERHADIVLGTLPAVTADGGQLARVFRNLIQNALKFGPPMGTRVEVDAVRRNGEWVFSVRDNGPGIDPAYADRIFQIFQRLERSNGQSGTGLGLAICKRIVQRHGGRIWVESQPGDGATFLFTIPDRSEAS